jgi:molecular chaperone HtpG
VYQYLTGVFMSQTMNFQTEVKQILNLVVNALYSNKEIFLRELVSNASDALDKLRFLALNNADLYEKDANLKIALSFDKDLKTLKLTDNGIGLSLEEARDNLGTIAKSGTKEFISQLSGDKASDSQLIGQFGVGFYSAFIVAKKVEVRSRKAGSAADAGVLWSSEGEGEFSVETINHKARGTEITLYLKDDAEEFLSAWRLRNIITKYSDHIAWPIEMEKIAMADESEDKDAAKQTPEFEIVNKATAIWTLPKAEVSKEAYIELYKHISHDYEDPLTWSHNHVEGKQEYISLLYLPSHAPMNLWQQDYKNGLKLYVKRVFIMDNAEEFLPRYLRFVKGIIDAADLPLNVSREILQNNKQIDTIRAACTKRVLGVLEKMATDDKDLYQKFWNTFGLVLKEGVIEDFANKEALAKLFRFATTHGVDATQNISLDDYVARMPETQDKIYYITAASYNAAKFSPHLEIFKKKGIEVILLSDRIDEWLVGHLHEFAGKQLQSISKGRVDLDDKSENQEDTSSFESMLVQMKTVLGEKIKDVQLTHRLTDSPACVVADENDMGFEMQRILMSAGQDVQKIKPIFEINPEHALIKRLHGITDDSKFANWTYVLFEQALLAEGGQLDNPADFVHRMNELLVSA